MKRGLTDLIIDNMIAAWEEVGGYSPDKNTAATKVYRRICKRQGVTRRLLRKKIIKEKAIYKMKH